MKDKTSAFLTKTPVVCLLAGVCSFLWGSAFPVIKIGYALFDIASDSTASQILFAGIRFTLAGILALIIGCFTSKKLLIPSKKDAAPIMLLSLFQTILQYFFFYIGMANTSGVKGSVIIGSSAFVAIIIAALVFRTEKLTAKTVIGSLIGFSGIILININGIAYGTMKLTGEGFVFLSTVAYAFSSCLMKNYSKKHDTILLSAYQFIFGGIVMTAAGAAAGGEISFAASYKDIPFSIAPIAIGVLIYLAIVSAVAYSLWSTLLRYNDVSRVSVFGFMNPMFGFILSAILLGERSEAFGITGIPAILLVCTGIYIVNKNKTVAKTEVL